MSLDVFWLGGQDFLKQLLGLADVAGRQGNVRQLIHQGQVAGATTASPRSICAAAKPRMASGLSDSMAGISTWAPKSGWTWAKAAPTDQQAQKREKIKGPAILINLVIKR
jgi:hypothetical protein